MTVSIKRDFEGRSQSFLFCGVEKIVPLAEFPGDTRLALFYGIYDTEIIKPEEIEYIKDN